MTTMGFFRTKKASRHTPAECMLEEKRSMLRMVELLADVQPGDDFFKAMDAECCIWAEWRECRARLEGNNESDVE